MLEDRPDKSAALLVSRMNKSGLSGSTRSRYSQWSGGTGGSCAFANFPAQGSINASKSTEVYRHTLRGIDHLPFLGHLLPEASAVSGENARVLRFNSRGESGAGAASSLSVLAHPVQSVTTGL